MGKSLDRIERAIKKEEPIAFLPISAKEAINKSNVKESLCPDIEYSTSDTGNKRSSMEIVFAFSLPRRKML